MDGHELSIINQLYDEVEKLVEENIKLKHHFYQLMPFLHAFMFATLDPDIITKLEELQRTLV